MGSFYGAEVCELVGTHLLYQLLKNIRDQVGLYRDDGLGTFQESNRRTEQAKKLMNRTQNLTTPRYMCTAKVITFRPL